jgi:peptide deformylase
MLLDIYYYDDPVLRKHCTPIKEITEEIRTLAQNMIETMDKSNGCGLAAPQIGHAIRLFVCRSYIHGDNGTWTLSPPKIYINPKLSSPGKRMLLDTEGCLSFPKLRLEIERPDSIIVEALDIHGKPFQEELEGYNARIRMHENDHINGVLFIDRVDAQTRKKIDPLLREMKKHKQ